MITRNASIKLLAIAGLMSLGVAPSAVAQAEEPLTRIEASTMTVETPVESVAQATGDIIDVASSNPEFSTLVTAIQTAGLVEPLQGEGPFTVFAPTNAAFEALPSGVVDALLMPENRDLLTEVLTYHVVPGELMSGDLSSGDVETLSGEDVMVTVADGVMVGGVDVIAADVPATNGVIHVIDEVLVPTTVATELQNRMAEMEAETMTPEPAPASPTPAAEPVRGLW